MRITELTALEMYKWLIIIGVAQIFHNEQPVRFSLLILFLEWHSLGSFILLAFLHLFVDLINENIWSSLFLWLGSKYLKFSVCYRGWLLACRGCCWSLSSWASMFSERQITAKIIIFCLFCSGDWNVMGRNILSNKIQFLMEAEWYHTSKSYPKDFNCDHRTTNLYFCPITCIRQGTGQCCKYITSQDLYFHLLLNLNCS